MYTKVGPSRNVTVVKGSGEAIMTTRFNAMFDETNMKHLEVFVTDSVFYINPPKHIQAATQAQRERDAHVQEYAHPRASTNARLPLRGAYDVVASFLKS